MGMEGGRYQKLLRGDVGVGEKSLNNSKYEGDAIPRPKKQAEQS